LARHSDPDSADAQFYINMNDNAHLDATPEAPGYTVFGRLIDGHTVAEDIELTETGIVNGRPAVPLEPITIIRARRIARGD
jgi:peptidyl-prolyl cis-trans isomerase A (cyclophilin A)